MQQANTTAPGIYEQTEWHVYESMNWPTVESWQRIHEVGAENV